MPISDGFKKIVTAWAGGPQGQRTDPDDAALTPPIDIAEGWDDTFSADSGNTLRRRVFNEIFYRPTDALINIRDYGILPWDVDVDTLQGGVKQVAGAVYKALVDNGPTFTNAISPTAAGQTVWESVAGVIGLAFRAGGTASRLT